MFYFSQREKLESLNRNIEKCFSFDEILLRIAFFHRLSNYIQKFKYSSDDTNSEGWLSEYSSDDTFIDDCSTEYSSDETFIDDCSTEYSSDDLFMDDSSTEDSSDDTFHFNDSHKLVFYI